MRQVICDNKGCKLEPIRHNLIGRGRVNISSRGGLTPIFESELLPFPNSTAASTGRKRKVLTGGGKKKQKKKTVKRKCVRKNGY